jgi:hypothetical protein
MHVNVPGTASHVQRDLDILTNDLHTIFGQAFAPVSNLAWTHEETNTVMYLADNAVLEAVGTGARSGQDSGTLTPAQVALVISWKSNSYIRGGHPRTYMAGVTFDRLATANTWSAQTIQDYDGAAFGFRGAVNGIALDGGSSVTLGYLQVYPPKGSVQVPPIFLDPPRFWPFTASTVHPRVDTQRRRLGRELST